MSSLKLIGQTVFKLESGNHTRTDGQTDGRTDGRRTHQSNRRIGYTQPAQKTETIVRPYKIHFKNSYNQCKKCVDAIIAVFRLLNTQATN